MPHDTRYPLSDLLEGHVRRTAMYRLALESWGYAPEGYRELLEWHSYFVMLPYLSSLSAEEARIKSRLAATVGFWFERAWAVHEGKGFDLSPEGGTAP